jgi:hypothetical protein
MRRLPRGVRITLTVVLLAFVAVSIGYVVPTQAVRPLRMAPSAAKEGTPHPRRNGRLLFLHLVALPI